VYHTGKLENGGGGAEKKENGGGEERAGIHEDNRHSGEEIQNERCGVPVPRIQG